MLPRRCSALRHPLQISRSYELRPDRVWTLSRDDMMHGHTSGALSRRIYYQAHRSMERPHHRSAPHCYLHSAYLIRSQARLRTAIPHTFLKADMDTLQHINFAS